MTEVPILDLVHAQKINKTYIITIASITVYNCITCTGRIVYLLTTFHIITCVIHEHNI